MGYNHGLNSLRSIMLLLGIVLHCSLPYLVYKIDSWDIVSDDTHLIHDLSVGFIHIFRMPFFFFLSGYLSSLSIAKNRSLNHFFKQRVQRLIIPLLFTYVTIIPLVYFVLESDIPHSYFPPNWHVYHIWFLIMLVCFQPLLLLSFVKRGPMPKILEFFKTKALLTTTILFLVSLVPMCFYFQGLAVAPVTMYFPMGTYLHYAAYFLLGAFLFHYHPIIEFSCRHGKKMLSLGCFVGLTSIMLMADVKDNTVFAILNTISCWLIILGCTGAAWNIKSTPKLLNFFSESSYGIYLYHLPFIFVLAPLLFLLNLLQTN